MNLEQIEKRLAELREHSAPGEPFDWDDVEYLRLLGQKLKLGWANTTSFNAQWFLDMAEKLAATLEHSAKDTEPLMDAVAEMRSRLEDIASGDVCQPALHAAAGLSVVREILEREND